MSKRVRIPSRLVWIVSSYSFLLLHFSWVRLLFKK